MPGGNELAQQTLPVGFLDPESFSGETQSEAPLQGTGQRPASTLGQQSVFEAPAGPGLQSRYVATFSTTTVGANPGRSKPATGNKPGRKQGKCDFCRRSCCHRTLGHRYKGTC